MLRCVIEAAEKAAGWPKHGSSGEPWDASEKAERHVDCDEPTAEGSKGTRRARTTTDAACFERARVII
eukprot:scaffold573310_cov43-Prasinocladus_malaysianus.AAC.1